MNHGTKPSAPSHKDYSWEKSMGAAAAPQFPPSYDTDAGVWKPDQNVAQSELGGIPPLPYGCTEYSVADLDNNLAGKLQSNPNDIEKGFHASQNGGATVRDALDYARKQIKWLGNYFNIEAKTLDMFDSIRYAILQGGLEKRGAIVGTPWYFEWMGKSGILPAPRDVQNVKQLPWHCWIVTGWETMNGIPYLKAKTWQGSRDFMYFDRATINAVFTVWGTVAYIPSNYDGNISRVSLPVLQMILSYLRLLAKNVYGVKLGATAMLWDTPAHIRRNVRMMCDDAGLSWSTKNLICAIIKQESNYDPKAVNNRNANGTVDRGLVQINDHAGYWIGSGLYFASVDEVLNDPAKSVRFIIMQAKAGKLSFWSSYKFGAYRQHLLSESRPSVPY